MEQIQDVGDERVMWGERSGCCGWRQEGTVPPLTRPGKGEFPRLEIRVQGYKKAKQRPSSGYPILPATMTPPQPTPLLRPSVSWPNWAYIIEEPIIALLFPHCQV